MLAGLGSRVLVCTGANPARHASLLAGLGMPAAVFAVAGEPTAELARSGVAAAREHGANVVAAIGGGSVIDLGKAVAMLLANGGDPLDYLEVVGAGRQITRHAAPCVAAPTTAGTGAEVTANAVLAVPEHRLKASLRSPLMIPRVALVDPQLTASCPPPVTAASGLDALTQCLEPFVSVRATPLTDGLAREGLRRAAAGLRAAHADGGDLAARMDMAMCALLGGMALANAKLGAVHGLAGVIGGTADVPHGMACAALLAPVIEANVRDPALRGTRLPRSGPVRRGGAAADREARRIHRGWPGLDRRDPHPARRARAGRVRPRCGAGGRYRGRGPGLEQHAGQPRPAGPGPAGGGLPGGPVTGSHPRRVLAVVVRRAGPASPGGLHDGPARARGHRHREPGRGAPTPRQAGSGRDASAMPSAPRAASRWRSPGT